MTNRFEKLFTRNTRVKDIFKAVESLTSHTPEDVFIDVGRTLTTLTVRKIDTLVSVNRLCKINEEVYSSAARMIYNRIVMSDVTDERKANFDLNTSMEEFFIDTHDAAPEAVAGMSFDLNVFCALSVSDSEYDDPFAFSPEEMEQAIFEAVSLIITSIIRYGKV